MKYILLFIALNLIFATSFAQSENKDSVVQFSGVVVTGDSLKSIPFVHIRIGGTNLGTKTDLRGFFSFVAKKGDTIIFSHVGYRQSYFYIPDTLKTERYSLFHMMENDTLLLQETVIYPWSDIEALEFAIINYRVPENDYDRAMKNLALQEMKERADNLDMDGAMNYRHQMQTVVDKAYWNGQYMPNQLLNPFAWAQFIKAWKEGKFKKDDE